MTTYLGKSCSIGFLCVSFMNVYEFVSASFPFGFDGGIWDFVVLVPNHRLLFYLICT